MIVIFIVIGYIIGLLLTAYFWGKLSDDMLEEMQLESHEDSLIGFLVLWPLSWLYVLGCILVPLFENVIMFLLNAGKK